MWLKVMTINVLRHCGMLSFRSIQDSYQRVMRLSQTHLRRRPFIQFTDEEGIDGGGLARSVYDILVR